LKIEEIGRTLADCGFVALDEQARVLGLSRSTAWTVLRGLHKSSGLSALTINRMLTARSLPAQVRSKILEYIAEKMSGSYGDQKHRLKAFASRLGPAHLQDAAVRANGQLELRDRRAASDYQSYPYCEARLACSRESQMANEQRSKGTDNLLPQPLRPRRYQSRG
jgi:hypothetical protein